MFALQAFCMLYGFDPVFHEERTVYGFSAIFIQKNDWKPVWINSELLGLVYNGFVQKGHFFGRFWAIFDRFRTKKRHFQPFPTISDLWKVQNALFPSSREKKQITLFVSLTFCWFYNNWGKECICTWGNSGKWGKSAFLGWKMSFWVIFKSKKWFFLLKKRFSAIKSAISR